MATAPQFAAIPDFGSATLTAAMTGSTTTPTNASTIFAAGANGGRVDEIDICGLGTTVANVIRIWLYNSANTTYYLIREVQVPQNTASATLPAYQQTLTFTNLMLPTSTYSLVAAIATADLSTGFRVSAFGGEF